MDKPHPIELRTRIMSYVEVGHGHRKTALVFSVSPRFANDIVKLKAPTGSLAPKRQGQSRPGQACGPCGLGAGAAAR